MRGVDQRIVLFRPFSALDFQYFLFDLFQGGDERSSSALLSLSVGSIISVPATGKEPSGVEAIVHQAFGDVGFGDAAFGFEQTQINDTFVRDAAVFACIQNRIVSLRRLAT